MDGGMKRIGIDMQFIREKWILLYGKIKQACSDYRVTVITVELFTLYAVVGGLWSDLNPEYESPVTDFLFSDMVLISFLMLFMIAAMFVESLFPYEKKHKKLTIARICGFVIGAVIAAVLVWGIDAGDMAEKAEFIFHLSGDVVAEWCGRFVVGYILLLIVAILYVCHRKSQIGFIEYILHVFVNFVIATAIYFVLLIGLNLIVSVVNALFLDGYSTLSIYVVILLTGIYYVPACIMAMNNMNNEIRDRIGLFLIKYVLSGMTICALAIVYIYLLKILIMWEMPSNEIFGIVAGLFCIGMPIWMIDYFYRDDTKYMRFLQILPFGLVPMIPVQAYAICVRVYHNGMTPSRYVGVAMILFETAMLFVWYFWKEKMERVLLMIGTGIIVAIFIPGVNMYSMSDRWQSTFLKTYYQKVLSQGELTQEEYERLKGAYDYLKWQSGKDELVKEFNIYDADFAAKLVMSGINEEGLTQKQYHNIHCCQMVGTLDVSGYSSFVMLSQDDRYQYFGDDRLPVDFSAFRFYRRGNDVQEAVIVDLSDFADRCIAYKEEHPDAGKDEYSKAMKPFTTIVIDENTVLYLNHFEVNYRDGIEEGKEFFEVSSVNVSGMLLSR
ncbi:MAG: DUF4153 domain-containing protein [Lachnospiraceae bacterium]|nr:DUF4153 domain-containing protein [Lachnospiraceae bacterium]